MPLRSSTSVGCTLTATACRRTTRRRSSGSGKAAEQGNADAQFNLGVMYRDGHGVTQDYTRAHMWFNLATSRATHTATRDQVAKNRDRAAAMMTPDQIAEAQRMASEWKPE